MATRNLIEKIEALPADKRAEVEDFVDNLATPPGDHGSSTEEPALVERLRARRERLLRRHGLYDTTPLIREFREAGR